jgi:hypothetical protein
MGGRSSEVALALALALAAAPVVLAGGSTRPPTRPDSTDDVAETAKVVAGLRGRPFLRGVPARVMSCPSAAARLADIARIEGARCSPDIERAVRALGFVEPDPPVTVPPPAHRDAFTPRSDDGGGSPCGLAFYDQIRKEIVVVEGKSSPDERGEVLAHELSHALQDQCFDLRARLRVLPRTPSGDHDAEELATNAAINEGEATVLELLYIWRGGADRSSIQGVVLEDPMTAASSLGGLPAPPAIARARRISTGVRSIATGTERAWLHQRHYGAKNYLQALARFQYLQGATFVAQAYERGGWAAVDALRTSPPASTEQLIHPERYFDSPDPPITVDASPLLAESSSRLRLLYDNRLGELGCMLVIEGDASGWGGDRYRVLERADGTSIVEARSVWDDEDAARRFATLAPRWLASMGLGEGTWDVIERRGRAVLLLAGLRREEVRSSCSVGLRDGPDGAFGAAVADAGSARATWIRRRGPGGVTSVEARTIDDAGTQRTLLAEHLDVRRAGSLETDGRSWGVRARAGGGVTWVRMEGERVELAAGSDRADAAESLDVLHMVLGEKARPSGRIDVRPADDPISPADGSPLRRP